MKRGGEEERRRGGEEERRRGEYHCSNLLSLGDDDEDVIRERSDDDLSVVVVDGGGNLFCLEGKGRCRGDIFLCFFQQAHSGGASCVAAYCVVRSEYQMKFNFAGQITMA